MAEEIEERDALLAQIPDSWEEAEKAYGQLTANDRRTRGLYRRTVDQAYEPLVDLKAMITSVDALAALEPQIQALADEAPTMDGETADERFKEVERMLGDVAGARDIRGLLSDARREIDARTPNVERGMEYLAEAQETFANEIAWRTRAAEELLPELEAYDEAIKLTIGLRKQPRLPREQALYVASCIAEHRDISLNF